MAEVGGAGIPLRQGMEKKYIPYKLPGKVIDCNSNWFYIGNHEPSLPKRVPRPPKLHWECTYLGHKKDQVAELLGRIELLRRSGITGASVVFSWIG